MALSGEPQGDRSDLDLAAARRAAHLSARQTQPPWLQAEGAGRREDRLAILRQPPATWLDDSAAPPDAALRALLARRYPKSQGFSAFLDADRPPEAIKNEAPISGLTRWLRGARPGVAWPGQAELLWSNMRLHAGADARGLLARWHGWLAVDGVLMFSCLGPDTLRELRALYAQAGWPPPAQDFVDMHDWGDRLVHAGFSGPVMDVERLTLTWPSPSALLTELRGLGRNLHPARYAGLRTPRWRERLLRALAERAGTDGRIAMSFEIVYGHAIKPAPRAALEPETAVTLSDMRDMLRAHNARGPRGRAG